MYKTPHLPVIFTLVFSGILSTATAQDTSNTIGQVSIASPTAASLGKFGDIPVNYHTGVPQIGIPIYTVQSGSLKLPIGLSYHASGIKVLEPAGWVGSGWALNAGGMITRTVVGAPDDRGNNPGTTITNGYYSDFGFESYLNQTGYTTPDDVSFARGVKDGQPDLYFFNFGGYTGKFYFNDDRTPILLPDQDFKIQPLFQTGYGFQGFVVITPDGTRYYFGQAGNDNSSVPPIESTIAGTTQNGYSSNSGVASSWFLNKVLSADGMDSINLVYQAESYSYYTLAMYPVLSSNYSASGSSYTQTGYNVVKNFINGVRLSQINFPNGQVIFTPSASPRTDLTAGMSVNSSFTDAANTSSYSLGSIAISNNLGFCKKDTFYYDYTRDTSALNTSLSFYNTYNLHADEYRLRLDSVKETSCDGSLLVPPYKFSYFTETLPRRLSFAVDHWGYANGQTGNTTLIPTYTVYSTGGTGPVSHPGDNRDASWPTMRAGTLQQITYPTGGYTQFNYGTKAIYNTTGSELSDVFLGAMVVNMYGQDEYSMRNTLNVENNNAPLTITVTYTANQDVSLTILNSSNAQVYYNPNIISSYQTTVSNLPGGTYTAILSIPDSAAVTGGAYATIQQEQNTTYQASFAVGGLRINSITSNDGLTPNNIVTNYDYLDANSMSNDILYSIPTYVQIIRNDLLGTVWPYCSPNGCSTCDGYSGHAYFVSPGTIRAMATMQGENVGYSEVDVSQTGNGKSVHKYYPSIYYSNNAYNLTDVCVRSIIQSSLCDGSIPNYPSAPVAFEPLREEQSYEGSFNQSGQALKEQYFYPVFVNDSMLTPGHVTVNVPGMYSYTEYNLQSMRKTQNKIVETDYDLANFAQVTKTTTVYYGSPYHNQPTRTVTTTSTGDSLVTNFKYALDYRIASCDAVPDSLPYYMTAVQNAGNTMASNITSCTPQVNNTTNCRATVFTTYRESLMQARQNLIRWRRRTYAPDSTNLVSACYVSALSAADTLLKPVLRLQNMYENAAIETSEWKDLNLLHASFTRYDTSTSPVGYAYPGRTKLINLQAPSATFTNSSVSGSTITKDSRYVDETFFTFANGNPLQVLPRNGLTFSYIWDYLNMMPIAKVSNAAQSDIAYTSFEANGQGNWSFTGTPATDATAPTGSKSYGLSSGSVSKSGLTSGTSYIVSYWSKTGSSYTVTGSTSVKQGKTINGWTYFEHTATGNTTITVSGSGSIDELRLYPSTAQMTTYTYTPVLGMTASCDVDNRITYYFYDGLGRLKWIKDQDLNIIKTIQYHYQTITGMQY
ncbi:MAG: hypothetical protein P4L51_14525 [Puia sp.]|nr:hypothetical protein [Puia sp.]